MSSDRNYGQHSISLDKIRAIYGAVSKHEATQGFSARQLEPDCISCQKERLNRIPKTAQCQAVCGKQKKLK